MLENEFPIRLDNDMTRISTLSVLVGATIVQYAGWTVVGWVLVVFGFLTLWLAHQLAIAPLYDNIPGCLEDY
jgi:hypothetical protein